jgi:diguanylate cyclase (GGDEF)-like protein/PAS domain S-box-containing protein
MAAVRHTLVIAAAGPVPNTLLMFAAGHPMGHDRFTETPVQRMTTLGGQGTSGLGQLFNLAQDMLCVAGFDGYMKEVNPAWQRTLGWTAAELTSRPYAEFIHPAHRGATPCALDVLIDGQHVMQYENRFRARDGSFRWLSWMATRSVEDGMIYAAAHDITKAKGLRQMAAARGAVTQIAADVGDWDEAGWQILKAVCTCLGWDVGALWLVDDDEQQLVWKHAYFAADDLRDLFGPEIRRDRRRIGESLVGLAWERDEPLISEDVLSDERFAAPAHAARAELGAGFAFPLRHAGTVIGVMGFGSRYIERMDDDVRGEAIDLAVQIEDVLGTLATSRKMYYMAFHDALTGLPNLALFRERANQALLMSRRLRTPLGIALADVDHFKKINDTYGHAAGDHVLCQVGTRLMDSLRGSDTVARLGGDEFAILFPATSSDGIERAIRKLRTALARGLRLGELEKIHVSVGFAITPNGEAGLDDLLKRADEDMYREKRIRSRAVERSRAKDVPADVMLRGRSIP